MRNFSVSFASTWRSVRKRLNSSMPMNPLPSVSSSLKTTFASPLKRTRTLQPSLNSAMLNFPLPLTSIALNAVFTSGYLSSSSVENARMASEPSGGRPSSRSRLRAGDKPPPWRSCPAAAASASRSRPSRPKAVMDLRRSGKLDMAAIDIRLASGEASGLTKPVNSWNCSLPRRVVKSCGFSTSTGTSRANSGYEIKPSPLRSIDLKMASIRLL
mmetsp:Transcript_26018/g.74981  ORF Transcript_26018/g.74981 Transcript_26018/m.74981 type:complete len:214 (+) Transcript_26018:712-1353(+)